MQKNKQLAFAEMLHTRFCHDMAGPVSAVNNGLEFFEEETSKDMRQQAVELIRLSAQESFIKLQMFRMAYGRANASTETSVEETRDIVSSYFAHGKITLDWPEVSAAGFDERISSETRQLLVNLVMIAAGFMVYGGTLAVREEKTGDKRRLLITGHYTRAKEDADALAILRGEGSQLEYTPSNITVFFLKELAVEHGILLSARQKEDSLVFSAEYSS